jgi:RNA polymerase sigma-70 factor (ECF subfamily)
MAGAELSELEALYRQRFPHFVRVGTALLRDEDRAVEAVQEAFAAAIRARRSFRREGPLEAWVWRMVVNEARKAKRFLGAPLAESTAEPAAEAGSPIRAAIAQLPERQRLALFLRYYADLDYRSIAAALEISPGTVGASLNAAHATLRRLLQEVQQ